MDVLSISIQAMKRVAIFLHKPIDLEPDLPFILGAKPGLNETMNAYEKYVGYCERGC